MKHIASITCLVVGLVWLSINAPTAFAEASQQSSAPIPMDQLGAVAGKQYQGDGLSVIATPDGASLRCAFQRLEGQVTREGLWLSSTADNNSGERFRVRAISVGRTDDFNFGELFPLNYVAADVRRLKLPDAETKTPDLFRASLRRLLQFDAALPPTGLVSVTDNVARFIRPGLTEEYTVSVDGVRQDFIIEQRPEGEGELRVELDVTGAKAEPLVNGARPVRYPAGGTATEPQNLLSHGARLVLDGSGRKLAYNRLRVTDATGRELSARMEVTGSARVSRAVSGVAHETSSNHSSVLAAAEINVERDFRRDAGNNTPEACAPRLAVLVDDAAAIYPVRIDPTFSDSDWISMGGIPGANGPVFTVGIDISGNLYIGGSFRAVGEIMANGIAKWNGTVWEALGSGLNPGSVVFALGVSGNDVYAGGSFTNAGGFSISRIAKWNGSNWAALGSGMNSTVFAISLSGNDVYAGGRFTKADGNTVNYVAKWNGSNWTALGAGLGNWVYALACSGTNLYAAGTFFSDGVGNPANHIAKWNGSVWTPLGAGLIGVGVAGDVRALAISGDNVYAGGDFTLAGGSVANYVAKWNGTNWEALGSGLNNSVRALAISGEELYVAGAFTTAGGGLATKFAKWNGTNWTALETGTNSDFNNLYALAISGSDVYAGGSFTSAGASYAHYIAKWSPNGWSTVAFGINKYVYALAIAGGDVYAGGFFKTAGSSNANYIAKWDGNYWMPLGTGMNSNVYALALSGNKIIAGGQFTTAGGNVASRIAQWDGNDWLPMGSGMDNDVLALAVSGTNLFASGKFTTAGGIAANGIAKWDGNNWSPLGSGLGVSSFGYRFVAGLLPWGSNIYVGGQFTTAGGISASNIAKWDGASWSALGLGMDWVVNSLAVSGSNLYAGGFFHTAGGSPANYVAMWNGSNWTPLGSGMDQAINTLAVSGSDLYAGGYFRTAGGIAANHIAKWDGNNWSPLGSGVDAVTVHALKVSGSSLFVGGEFFLAGDKVSAYIAKANISGLPFPGRFSNLLNSPPTGFSCTFLDATVGQPYRIQTSPSLAAGSWTDFTNFTYTAPVVITVPVAGNTNRFFRAITP